MAERTVIESGVIRVDASGRRQYSLEFKRRLAKLALEPGASVAGIALAHRINANQLFKWRQDYLRQRGETAAREPTWNVVPGILAHLVTGDLNGDGKADLAGLAASGQVFYSTNRSTWTYLP